MPKKKYIVTLDDVEQEELRLHISELLVITTQTGYKIYYNIIRQDFLSPLKAMWVKKREGTFHNFRRLFANW